jgi:iron(III) transport system substrate-binding protein
MKPDRRTVVSSLLGLPLLPVLARSAHAAWQDNAAVKALYDKAKAEGQVMVWGTQQGEVDWIPKAFNAMFPGIEVQWVGDNDIATKAIAEARGGRHQVDVFWHSLTGVGPMVQRDLIAKVDWAPFGVLPAGTTFDGRGAYTSNIAYALAFNSELVKKEDVPKRWDAFTDPKYKGKLTASLFLLPRLSGALSLAWGMEKTQQFVRDILANEILLTRAPREPIINSGERLYGLGEVDNLVRRWGRAGLKIDYVHPEPIVLGQFVSTVMTNAPHPNAARLLAGFLASVDGKEARSNATFAGDYSAAGTSEFAKLVNSGKVQVVHDTPENMAQRENAIRVFGPIVAGQK